MKVKYDDIKVQYNEEMHTNNLSYILLREKFQVVGDSKFLY